ncbi:hypothetical protein Tco_0853567 [Tanacetum coccineum]
MLNEAIKQSKSYPMFIKYSTSHIPLKKSRGKGSQRKKTNDDSQEIVEVFEESEPEPKPVKRNTTSRRVVKKKFTIFVNDNIISDDPDAILELGKSMSLTEAEELEVARKVHATHARIVTESDPESAKNKSDGRSSRGVTIQDTPSVPKPKPAMSKPKLKGAQSLTLVEKEDAYIMQALKESKKTSKRQPEEDKLDDEENDVKEGDANEEHDDHISDIQDTNDEDDENESDEEEIYKYKIRVRKDEDEEMLNDGVEYSDKGDEKVNDAAKADAEKTSEVKDDAKKTELPPTSSSLSVSSGFGDQFLKLSSDSSLVSTVKNTIDSEINSLLEVRVAKLKKDVSELKKIDRSAEALAALKT